MSNRTERADERPHRFQVHAGVALLFPGGLKVWTARGNAKNARTDITGIARATAAISAKAQVIGVPAKACLQEASISRRTA